MSVNNALAAHPRVDASELTLRCDNGSQYRSKAFRESMKALGIKLEFIYYNTPEQNGHIESFHKTLKKEYLWSQDIRNYQEAEIAIADAFRDYNETRPHSSLGYRTPYEFLSYWEMKEKVLTFRAKKRSPFTGSTHITHISPRDSSRMCCDCLFPYTH
ncbi:MAG: transposase [Nitrososphaerales archaeon]